MTGFYFEKLILDDEIRKKNNKTRNKREYRAI
jgi:hypothetical protein